MTQEGMQIAISIASAVIALSALGISLWQGYLLMQHNRVSIKPHIDFYLNSSLKEGSGIKISNCGLGPAIFNSLSAKIGSTSYELESSQAIQDFGKALINKPANYSLETCAPHDECALAVGEEMNIVEFIPKEDAHEFNRLLSSRLYSVTLRLEYTCLYGKKHVSEHKASNRA
ncbi:hypothetical protein [Pseudomonas sp.]|uniref:hypothetical protein n=1 Tax=Pseudomonas sp. TaxID=306 RepID=UPI0027316E0E|nr:hypothetical protein [Pseudomonas sp.]MDP2447372.1 hypothetical protein [Pseudomonas sp.]